MNTYIRIELFCAQSNRPNAHEDINIAGLGRRQVSSAIKSAYVRARALVLSPAVRTVRVGVIHAD